MVEDNVDEAMKESQRLEAEAQRRAKANENSEKDKDYITAMAKLDTMKAGVTGKEDGDLTTDKYDELVKVGSKVLGELDLTNSTDYVKKALRTSLAGEHVISDKNHITPRQYEQLDKYGVVDTLIDASRAKKGQYESDKSKNPMKDNIDVIDLK